MTFIEDTIQRPVVSGTKKRSATRKHIRGSGLLLAGRLLSVGINFASQVLMVRYLSTSDYGAWAYALSIVAFCQGFATLGLDRAITRFIPIYHEKHEYAKLFGTIVLVVGSILLTCLVTIVAFYSAPQELARLMSDDQQPLLLLFVMIFMVPVEALDGLLIGLFASFASPRAIFFRKHVLGPSLKFAVVTLLLLWQAKVLFLAYGYLSASLLGVLIYTWVLLRLLRRQGLLAHWSRSKLEIPTKEVFSFTIPLMTSDLVTMLMQSLGVMLLGYFHNTAEVAFFRVVLPAAHLNKLIMLSFALLYTPTTARMFARQDYEGINHLYWQTALWMVVLSFPIFAVTFSLAEPLTVLLYGERYAASGVILALVSFGYFFDVALGFNGLTLKVLGKLRYVVIINIVAALVNVALNFLLIPRYGALGAGIASAGSLVAHTLLKHAGLRLAAGVSRFDAKYTGFYLLIALSAFGLFGLQHWLALNIYLSFALASVASLLVLTVARRYLEIEDTFPELLKVPLLRRFLKH